MNDDIQSIDISAPSGTFYVTGVNPSIDFWVTEGPSSAFYFQPAIQCEYNPQPDITTYELAQIVPYLFGRLMYETDWQKLGAATRHLKRP